MDRIKNQVENLGRALGENSAPTVEKENGIAIVTVNIRKCLMLRVVLDQDEPNSIRSAKLYVSETNNLKPERVTSIKQFLANANSALESLVNEANIQECSLDQLYQKCVLLSSDQSYLAETFDVIETRSKTCTFKFEDESVELLTKASEKNSKRKVHTTQEAEANKNQKFKGADIIFQRIKWDENIDKKQAIIGYSDRFLGIKEIKFDEFKGVHDDKEGVPLHRIRYFKINDRIVWDRERKIDLLTGSEEFFETSEEINPPKEIEEEAEIPETAEVLVDGTVMEYFEGDWTTEPKRLSSACQQQFKLLSYNLMSKVNFKKSILSKMNFKKSQMEVASRAIDGEDEYGLKSLEKIDRMAPIVASIRSGNWDFLVFQECDQHEETKLMEDEFIQKNYFICTLSRRKAKIEHPNCVILSKSRPVLFKLLRLTENSNKYALIAKFKTQQNSQEHLVLINVHLSSNKAKNFNEKRKIQLETLKRYLIDQADEFDLTGEHYFLCGDFNFDDRSENELENSLMRDLFIKNGFEDLVTNVCTFDPEKNFSAAVTAFNTVPRRLDRILYKSTSNDGFELLNAFLVNTAPFVIPSGSINPIMYQPYLSIKSYTQRNRVKIDLNSECQNEIQCETELKPEEFRIHPSDHYGIECSFSKKKSTKSSVVHKSALAILAPNYSAQSIIQSVRKAHDPQIDRWPPHINILYPFFEDISLESVAPDAESSLMGEIFACLSRFRPFRCDLDRLNTFGNNGVVFLEPSKEATQQIKRIYDELVSLLSPYLTKSDGAQVKWKRISLTPHMTSRQPAEKRKVDKNWATERLELIKNEFLSRNDGVPMRFLEELRRPKFTQMVIGECSLQNIQVVKF